MTRTSERDERIVRYLLGDLAESEQLAIERECFADPEKFEAVWAAENDLVDRYVRRRLSAGEQELFERNYLQSPKHQNRVAFAEDLLKAADLAAGESRAASSLVEPELSLRSRMMEALSSLRMLRGALAAATLVLFVGSAALLLERARLNEELGRTRAQLSGQQRREHEFADQLAAERAQSGRLKSELERLQEIFAQRPSQPLSQTDRRSVLSFLLSPLLPRSGGEPQLITIPRSTDSIRFQMKIEEQDSRRFQAAIRTVEGARVWSQRTLTPRSGSITVDVPVDKLSLGDYILTLSAANPTGETEEINRYFFRVIRK